LVYGTIKDGDANTGVALGFGPEGWQTGELIDVECSSGWGDGSDGWHHGKLALLRMD
ncbi:MAG: hypothetical protein F6K30_23860, partial [Cyanothece sp. SIO2G6]|nr:hypothetical protein [Cyanothece sp. SIO2G6]